MTLALKTKISTTRLDEMRAFYQRVFGLVVAEEWDDPDDRGVILAFPDGADEAFLELWAVREVEHRGGTSLQFRVPDLGAFLDQLPPDIPYEGPKPRPWGSTYLYLCDPEGLPLVVYEGGL